MKARRHRGSKARLVGCVLAVVCAAGTRLIAPAHPAPSRDVDRSAVAPVPSVAAPLVRPRPPKRRPVPPAPLTAAAPAALPAATVSIPEPPHVPAMPLAAVVELPIPSVSLALESPTQLPRATPLQLPPPLMRAPPAPRALVPLYVSFATLQALDVHSTRVALDSGYGREANPLLGGASQSSAGLIAIKAASTVFVIYGTEKLRKKNRVAAVVLMVGLNSATAIIVARNYKIAK